MAPIDPTVCNCQCDPFTYIDEDGICNSEEVEGCTDFNACNFNIDATIDDGSCIYPEDNYDCYGNCNC